jgi:hypothetical protein
MAEHSAGKRKGEMVGEMKTATSGSRRFPARDVAPQVGLEPTTLRLTAECSAIELLRKIRALARRLLWA